MNNRMYPIQLMIVDDDYDLRDSLKAYFCQPEFNVQTFSSGEKLLGKLPDHFDGVIICDLKMPGMNGLEVLEAVQKRGDAPPFILMTAFGDIPLAVNAMHLGAYDFLEKPFDPAYLQRKIQQAAVIRTQQMVNTPLGEQRKLRDYVDNFEKSLLEQALQECQGHVGKVCDLLSIPRRTLNEKLVKHGINRQQYLS